MPRVALNVAILRVNIKVPGESFTGAQRLAFLAGNKAQEKREKKESRKEEKKRIKREGERVAGGEGVADAGLAFMALQDAERAGHKNL